jgi:hypothetical protein
MGPRGPNESATSRGYANDVQALLAKEGRSLALYNIACPGETIQTFVAGGDACSPATSQLEHAEQVLRSHATENGVVTIDVGFNNIRPCLQFASVDERCVARSVELIKRKLPSALASLQKAAGPGVVLVGVPYGDPFLGHYLDPSRGPTNATQTLAAMDQLDAALDAAFRLEHVVVAPVAADLKVGDRQMTGREGSRSVPQDVAETCATTWMCRDAPWGPNDHPNNKGYSLIAKAIVSALPPSL